MPSIKKKARKSPKKEQSAMEYLMTYGWAILIIAVVLGVLYYLGIFNGANIAPKLPPGSCQVVRPSGVDTTQNINTEGECLNGLPEYVAKFTGNSLITIPGVASPYYTGQLTMTEWIYTSSPTSAAGGGATANYQSTGGSQCQAGIIGATTNSIDARVQEQGTPGTPQSAFGFYNNGGWTFAAFTFGGSPGTINLYLNGALANTISTSISLDPPANIIDLVVGSTEPMDCGGTSFSNFDGMMANLQVYNTTLDANAIQSLYSEGIGGVPQELGSLVGWWPLNGDVNDYSGNLHDGSPANVVFTDLWTYYYTSP